MTEPIRRRRLVVDWRLQLSLCLHELVNGVLLLVVLSAGVFLPLLWDLAEHDPAGAFDDSAIALLYLHERFWWVAAICLLVLVFGGVRFSHRIAGPMVRFKRNLRLLAKGRLPGPLRTRRADFLKEEVDCLNAAVAGVQERLMVIDRSERALRRALQAAEDSPPGSAPDLTMVRACAEELRRSVAAFHEVETGDELVQLTAATSLATAEGG